MKLLHFVFLGVITFSCVAVSAQTYSARPIRLLVGASAGGTTDIVARMVAAGLTERLGQQVVVENRGGAGGIIALDAVAKSQPDGYVLGMAYSGLSINPLVMKSMPFDTLKDLAPVSLVASVKMFLVVGSELPVKSLGELVERAKAEPGRLPIAASALASVSHLSAELFKLRTTVDIPTVVYKGSAPALVDLVGGSGAAMFDTVPGALPTIKTGRIRALAVGGTERLDILPEVPTLEEAGLKNYDVGS